jgi:hypothetical protein
MIFPCLETQEDRMKYEIRKLSFGETFGETFNLYFDNFGPLFLISLISSIPTILMSRDFNANAPYTEAEQQVMMLRGLFWLLIFIAVNTLSTALMIEFISKKYLKQHQTIGRYIKNVLPFIFPIMGLSIVEAIIVGLGFLAFVIPGIYFALALSVSSQVLIVERKGVFQSIRRSFNLTRGYKLEIFGYYLVLFLISLGIGLLSGQLLKLLENMQVSRQLQILIEHLVQVLLAPIGACLFILIYFNLRIDKEGFALEHLVEQFGSSSDEDQ